MDTSNHAPPLRRVPHLARLLGPEERIIHTPKLHWTFGWEWLAGSLLALIPAFLGWRYGGYWGLIPALVLFAVYYLPFHHFEMAVTTHRLLSRTGRLRIRFNDIAPNHIDRWELDQPSTLFDTGHVIIYQISGRSVFTTVFPSIDKPLVMLEALSTLSPSLQEHREIKQPSPLEQGTKEEKRESPK